MDLLHHFRLIESSNNERIKRIKVHLQGGLAATKLRQETQETVLEGVHLLDAWLKAKQSANIRSIVTTLASLQHPEIAAMFELLITLLTTENRAFPELILVEEKLAKTLSSFAHGPILICTIQIPDEDFMSIESQFNIVIDAVQDAGNVGSILRTATAAGIKQVFCTKGTAHVWSAKVLRAAMGAHPHLQIREGMSPEDFSGLKQPVLITSLNPKSQSIYTLSEQLKSPHTWVFGNEGSGVHPDFYKIGTSVFIPQHTGMESLNVACASAICLFEARRIRVYT